jgi:hypothetical protein
LFAHCLLVMYGKVNFMAQIYTIIMRIHNLVGSLTLLLVLIAAVMLLVVARTQTGGSAIVLRGALISASIQFLLGVTMVIIALVAFGAAYAATFWFHYLLGIASVGVVSAVTARARRAPDRDARRYGLMMLGVVALVLVTFLVGQFRYTLI